MEVIERDTGKMVAHAYWGMGTRPMLSCLGGVVVRALDDRFLVRLRQMLRKFWPSIRVRVDHTSVDDDSPAESMELIKDIIDKDDDNIQTDV